MPLTFEQFKKLREEGLSVEKIASFESGATPQSLRSERQIASQIEGNQFEREPSTGLGKARDVATNVIGGGKLAEGAGLGIAAPFVRKDLEKSSQMLSEVQNNVIERIKEKRARGEDVTRLQAVLKESVGFNQAMADAQSDFVDTLPTKREVIGSSVRLATTLGSGALGRFGANAAGLSKATTIGGGIARGAGAGAISGGIGGAIHGGGVAAEQGGDLADISKGVALGTGSGIVAGGVLGGVFGGFQGGLRGKQLRNAEQIEDIVSPYENTKSRTEAIIRGEMRDPGALKEATLAPSARTQELAQAAQGVVKKGNTVSQNVSALNSKIDSVNKGVANYVKNNKVPFNKNQLRTQLNSGKEELELVFASDATAEKTYNAVVNAFMKQVGKGDTAGLLRARKDFDKLPAVLKLLKNEALGENAKREIVLAVRGAANKYTASLLPPNNTFRADLLQQHRLIEALWNVARKGQLQIGKNQLQLLNEKYPALKWLIGSLLIGGGVGGGSAIIEST